MIKQVLKLSVLICVAAAVYHGYDHWVHGRFIERTDNAYIRSDIVAVAPKVPGYVIEVAVRDNEWVEQGDLLYRIDPVDFEARLAQSLAALDAAKAGRAALSEQRGLQKALIKEAQAGVSAARAEAERAGKDRTRADNLVRDGWTTRQRHDTSVATEARARAGVDQAEAGLAARKQRLNVLTAEASRLDAAVAQAEASVRLARIALEDSSVRAPVSGVVGNRHVEVGHYARPGAPLLSIVPLDDVWVVANFKETQLADMSPGQAVTVNVDTFGSTKISGRIDSLAPASGAEFSLLPPDNATGNFVRVVQRIPIKIVLDQQEGIAEGLRPGMSAEVIVDTRETSAEEAPSILDLAWAVVFERTQNGQAEAAE